MCSLLSNIYGYTFKKKYDDRYLKIKMEHNKQSIRQAKAFGFYYTMSGICSFSTWAFCTVSAFVSFALFHNVCLLIFHCA